MPAVASVATAARPPSTSGEVARLPDRKAITSPLLEVSSKR
jgi:hypothetical protein